MKHNYTCELELKSLLIRFNNRGKTTTRWNNLINRYIQLFKKLEYVRMPTEEYRRHVVQIRAKLKDRIVKLSEETAIDSTSYDNLGKIILLMIKNILTKPQFSGYSYRDDFFSDAVYKILRYSYNFDHTLISKISGRPVNAFAYISQIIHNSIIFVISTNKRRLNEELKQYQNYKILNNKTHNEFFEPPKGPTPEKCNLTRVFSETETEEDIENFIKNVDFEKFAKVVLACPHKDIASLKKYFRTENVEFVEDV